MGVADARHDLRPRTRVGDERHTGKCLALTHVGTEHGDEALRVDATRRHDPVRRGEHLIDGCRQLLDAEQCEALGLITSAPDHIDWEDEVRIFLEERSSFSADGLTGMEANLRFAGPETMETKIFGRLTAWQNWIFLRPNASGPEGALRRYGTGRKADFDQKRV